MSIETISVDYFYACSSSVVKFITLISEVEGQLLTIRALNNCEIPDNIDQDGWPERAQYIVWISEIIGEIYESALIPEYLIQKYLTDIIILGNEIDDCAWNYGFGLGVVNARDLLYDM